MTQEEITPRWGSNMLWNRIALVAGIFALLVGVLMIANYVQYKKADPIHMTVINSLVDRLSENPADSSLRAQIRTLDLLYRKAYFTSQWQIRMGGYMLLASLALMIIALQVVEYRKKIIPVLSSETSDETMLQNRKARKWIVLGGSAILLTAMAFGFLASYNLTEKLKPQNKEEHASLQQDIASGKITVNNLAPAGTDTTQESVPSVMSDTASPNVTPKPGPSTPAEVRVSSDNFPDFRGVAGASSKRDIPVTWDGPSGSGILWKTAIPLPGHNSPVIWGDKLFITGASVDKREVYCFDRVNGKLLWSVSVGSGNKKPKVSEETGYAAPTAVTDGKGVYAIFATADVAGIDMNGNKLWERDLGLPDNHYGHASSLNYAKGNIIIQFDQRTSQKIMALSPQTGKTVWSTNRPVKTSWSSPIVVNTSKGAEIITDAEPYVAAYNPANGQELWKIDCISGEVGPSLGYANGIVYSVNDYSKLTAIKIGDQPSVLWENNEYLSDIPSPAATAQYLFLATSYGTLVCYDAVTGQKYWEHDFGKSIYSSPMVVDDKVYVSDITGVMHIFKAAKVFQLIAEPKLGEYIAATPAFTNGRIYLRGEENLYCIGK